MVNGRQWSVVNERQHADTGGPDDFGNKQTRRFRDRRLQQQSSNRPNASRGWLHLIDH
jgi:hypothetical protein